MKKWQTLDSKITYRCKWFKIIKDKFRTKAGKIGDYHYLQSNNAVIIVPIDANGKLILVRQYRYTIKSDSWELPCGGRKHKSPLKDAKIELEEETGYKAKRFIKLGIIYPSNSRTDEKLDVYLAKDLVKTTQKLDDTEEGMIAKQFSIRQIKEMIGKNIIKDSPTVHAFILAIQYLKINL